MTLQPAKEIRPVMALDLNTRALNFRRGEEELVAGIWANPFIIRITTA